MRHPFRRSKFSPRLLPVFAVAILTYALARPTLLSFALGAPLVALGAALRIWGTGYLVKNDVLSVVGPYAHLRHPLYAGTLCLGLGFGVIAGGWALLLVLGSFLPAFFLYYFPVQGADRERATRAAFWPRLRRVPSFGAGPAALALTLRTRGRQPRATSAGASGGCATTTRMGRCWQSASRSCCSRCVPC